MGTSTTNMDISMDIDNEGYPVIANQQILSEGARPALRLVWPFMAYSDGNIGNYGEVPPGYMFQYWRCSTLDNASAETAEGRYLSLGVRSSELVAVVYTEDDDYYGANSLKIAYQYIQIFMPLINKP